MLQLLFFIRTRAIFFVLFVCVGGQSALPHVLGVDTSASLSSSPRGARPSTQTFRSSLGSAFMENAGQLPDSILFYCELQNGTAVYFSAHGYLVEHTEWVRDSTDAAEHMHHPTYANKGIRGHGYFVHFLHANAHPQVQMQKTLPFQVNFMLGYLEKCKKEGAIHARAARSIEYTNLYPGIRLRFFLQNGAVKYNIIVEKGAKLSDFQMQFFGVNRLKVKAKRLELTTSVTSIVESIPESYQIAEDGEKQLIDVRYKQDKKTGAVYLKARNADENQQLIVDPVLVFATFSGVTADNWGFTATYGKDGSMYLCGIVFKISSYRGTIGAFQRQYAATPLERQGEGVYSASPNSPDILLQKFSSEGTDLSYATFIGGTLDELPHSIVEDNDGHLILLGRTNSPDFPEHKNTLRRYGPGNASASRSSKQRFDILLCKVSRNGDSLLRTWIVGGSGLDGANITGRYSNSPKGAEELFNFYGDDSRGEVNIDKHGYIYVGSQTQSTDFPTTVANPDDGTYPAIQSTLSGQQDAVVMMFDPLLDRVLFSSYLGGSHNDAAFVITRQENTNASGRRTGTSIYVAGSTHSTNFPTTQGVVRQQSDGSIDGFLTHIELTNPAQSAIKHSTFLGVDKGYDGVYGQRINKKGYIFITGISSGDWPNINAKYRDEGAKQFIGKLKPDLSGWEYVTTFGTKATAPNISPVAFAIDNCEHLYVSGFGFMGPSFRNVGTKGMRTTKDALMDKTDNADFYFVVFDKDAQDILYATYYGKAGALGDHVDGGTSRYDPNGIIYQAICACNSNAYPITPGVYAPRRGNLYECNTLGIKMDFQLAGVAADFLTSYHEPESKKNIVGRTDGCVPGKFFFESTGSRAEEIEIDFGDGVSVTRKGEDVDKPVTHTYTKAGEYDVTLIAKDPNTCNMTDTAKGKICVQSNRVIPDFSIGLKTGNCNSLTYSFLNQSYVDPTNIKQDIPFDSLRFLWNFGDGTSQTTQGKTSVTHSFSAPGAYQVGLQVLKTDDDCYNGINPCNHGIPTEKIVRVSNNLHVSAEISTGGLCVNEPVTIRNTSTGGETFTWFVSGNGVSERITAEHFTYTFPKAGTYQIDLHGFDRNTCNLYSDTSLTITVDDPAPAKFSYTYDNPEQQELPRFINESNARHYLWSFGDEDTLRTNTADTTIYHLYNRTGTYDVCLTAYNSVNCQRTTCQKVKVAVNLLVEAPSAFTPNGDGINDKFLPIVRNAESYELNIYNRWGQKVFSTTNQTEGWDGTVNRQGPVQPSDMYFYTISVRTNEGERKVTRGAFYLINK